MEDLTVISGSGERFKLSLQRSSIEQSAAVLREALELPPEPCRQKAAAALKGFFPSRYRTALENLSLQDLRRLVSAFDLLLKKSRKEDPAVQLQLPFDSGESFSSVSSGKGSFPGEKSFQDETRPALPQEQEHSPFLFPEFSASEEPPSAAEEKNRDFSDEVIAAAFCYKWHLEYAASLSPGLLKRCLAAAGVKQSCRLQTPAAPISPEEMAHAVRRGQEALRRFRQGSEKAPASSP